MTTNFSPDRLKALLEARTITEYELSARIGYPRQMVNHWTNGVELPPIKALMAICDRFDVKIAYFFPDNVAATVEAAPYRTAKPAADPAKKAEGNKKKARPARLTPRSSKGALASA